MIAASRMAGYTLDGRGQVAIALGDEVGELVDLRGRFGRGLDLNPAADAIEDFVGIKRIGGHGWRDALRVRLILRARQRAPGMHIPDFGISQTDTAGISACRGLRAPRSVRP